MLNGWPPGFSSVVRCGAQGCALCCQPWCSFPGSHGVAALPSGIGSGVSLQQTSTSTEQGVVGLTASAEGFHLAPAPTLLNGLSCGPRQPAPGRRFPVPQQAAERGSAAINPGSTGND
ncbi:hypothetical protein [Pectobacterium wasabiae]|uniref:hypothetical protein n=1 Tax=Pectobacterium wasabiae TaxID=55208 RepID=UPI0002E918C1|nr:hypothetical protein [Pectobacterium wasabiae]